MVANFFLIQRFLILNIRTKFLKSKTFNKPKTLLSFETPHLRDCMYEVQYVQSMSDGRSTSEMRVKRALGSMFSFQASVRTLTCGSSVRNAVRTKRFSATDAGPISSTQRRRKPGRRAHTCSEQNRLYEQKHSVLHK